MGGASNAAEKAKPRSSGRGERSQRHSNPTAAVGEQRAAARPVSASVDPAAGTAAGGGSSHLAAYVLGGVGGLILVLAGGFVWYRRRPP